MIRGERGLSLIELVVAMALFALVAVMGAQGLSGMLRLRDGLESRASASAGLSEALSLLRADLDAALPMLFFSPGEGPIRSPMAAEPEGFSLSVGGQSVLPAETRPGPALHRIEWRLDSGSGQLLRRRWATLTPADQSARSPEMVVLEDVRALRLRSYWGDAGWVPGLTPPRAVASPPSGQDGDGGAGARVSYSGALPLGVEITLITDRFGEITLLEAVQ